jgi:hypothetical protein
VGGAGRLLGGRCGASAKCRSESVSSDLVLRDAALRRWPSIRKLGEDGVPLISRRCEPECETSSSKKLWLPSLVGGLLKLSLRPRACRRFCDDCEPDLIGMAAGRGALIESCIPYPRSSSNAYFLSCPYREDIDAGGGPRLNCCLPC